MTIYQLGFWIILGVALGIFIALKWISPPSDDIRIGRVVIRGRHNIVQDAIDIQQPDKKPPKRRRFTRRERKEMKAKKNAG